MERWTPAYERLFDPEHELALDEPVCPRWAWLDLVQMARREPGTRVVRMAPLQLDRGELVVSIRYLADRWRWHRNRVQRFLAMLESEEIGKIEATRSTPQGTIYRITNYDAYALAGTGNGTAGGTGHDAEPRDEPEILGTDSGTHTGTGTGHPRDTHGTGTGQETGHPPSRNGATNPEGVGQKVGQSRGGEGEKGRDKPRTYPPDFERVWKTHPRGSKKHAYEQYRAVVPHEVSAEKLIDYLQQYRSTFTNGFQGQHLFRWIRDRRWEELVEAPHMSGAPDAVPASRLREAMRRWDD